MVSLPPRHLRNWVVCLSCRITMLAGMLPMHAARCDGSRPPGHNH